MANIGIGLPLRVLRGPIRSLVLVSLLLGALALHSLSVYAHGVLDQVNDPPAGTSISCGIPGSLYQSFTPGGPSTLLAAVDLRLSAGENFPAAGFTTKVKIRSGSPTGPLLAEANTFVPGPQISGAQFLVHFDFSPPVVVQPGNIYVIEWISNPPGAGVLSWTGRIDNPYGSGNMFSCSGTAVAIVDLNFQTHLLPAVSIDIKPGSEPNSINPKSKGVIPVAILTTDTFDATTVDADTVRFGPGAAVKAHKKVHVEDVDSDGDLDLVLHFRTQDTGIVCGDTSASLVGATFGGQAIEGSDSIKVKCD